MYFTLSPNEIDNLKNMAFEIYSAGFTAGYSQEIDIKTAYEKYWKFLKELILKENDYEKNYNRRRRMDQGCRGRKV